MTEEEYRRLQARRALEDPNYGMFGMDRSQIPMPVAGAPVVNASMVGGLMNIGRKAGPWIRRNIVNPIKEVPKPAKIAFGTGAAGAGALLMDE